MNQNYLDIYKKSIKNPETFWSEIAESIFWYKKPSKILNKSKPPFYKWYEDGITNTCYNALDFHVERGLGKKIALIYDSAITGKKNKLSHLFDPLTSTPNTGIKEMNKIEIKNK